MSSELSLALDALKVNRKDPRAWRTLYGALRPLIVTRIFWKGVRDRNQIEDLVQQAFVRLFLYCDWSALENEHELKAYASTVAKHAAFSWHSQKQPEREVPLEESLPAPESAELGAEDPAGDSPQLSVQDLPADLLARLSPGEVAIIDALANGYAYPAIAAKLGITEPTLRVRLSRLRRKLAGS